uniref:Uncharacterized protein n=1 Tax=Candidatus Kentrum sp. SD TaxID=2126332 RepID=A0A450YRW2_9GAMM|nr:MAG: hypothetical protein BECKSD772F_GA0070984_11751 [Candidatus Kentron sp. SD]VFK49266.1 MAG: hypothetical protein BECKSD772E_GA0070983_11681 [Candidatus Kentron sp. SD]
MFRVFLIGLIGFIVSGCILVVDPSDPELITIIGREPPPTLYRPSKQDIQDIAAQYKRHEKDHPSSRIQVIGTLPSDATFADRSVLSRAMRQVEDSLVEQGIDREDIEQKKVVDDNAPPSGWVELGPLRETTSEPSFRPRSSGPILHEGHPPVREISEAATVPMQEEKPILPFVKAPPTKGNNIVPKTDRDATRPSPATPGSPAGQSKQGSLPFIPESDKDPGRFDTGERVSKDDILRKEKAKRPLIPAGKSDLPDISGSSFESETFQSEAKSPTFGQENNEELRAKSPGLPETIYFGGTVVQENPDFVIPVLRSSSNPNVTEGGVIEIAHAGSNSPPPKRCIDGRLGARPLVERDEFRVGFDPGIYFYSGNHHRVYLSPIWLDNDQLRLADRIRILGYDMRKKDEKLLFEFETDTEIHLIDSYIVFRSYPTDPMNAPILCVDAWISLGNPGRNGKVSMYYRHDDSIYEYGEAPLRRLSTALHLRRIAP